MEQNNQFQVNPEYMIEDLSNEVRRLVVENAQLKAVLRQLQEERQNEQQTSQE